MAYISVVLLTLTVVITLVSSWNPCPGPDCVKHVTDFASCKEYVKSRTRNCRWASNMNRRLDEIILKGTIIAYKILWWSGSWSGWYVPGQNDLDLKYNRFARKCPIPYRARSLRRMWSYFYDHTHRYIICSSAPNVVVPLRPHRLQESKQEVIKLSAL